MLKLIAANLALMQFGAPIKPEKLTDAQTTSWKSWQQNSWDPLACTRSNIIALLISMEIKISKNVNTPQSAVKNKTAKLMVARNKNFVAWM